jgi:hypothetical protein
VYKYPQYHNNDPEEIVRLVVYNSINGDNTLLNNKLEQLHAIDRRLNGWSRERIKSMTVFLINYQRYRT